MNSVLRFRAGACTACCRQARRELKRLELEADRAEREREEEMAKLRLNLLVRAAFALPIVVALKSSACARCPGLHSLLPRPLQPDHAQGARVVLLVHLQFAPHMHVVLRSWHVHSSVANEANMHQCLRCGPSFSLPATPLPSQRCRACGEWRERASSWRLRVSECV